jgi:hypothetical protein
MGILIISQMDVNAVLAHGGAPSGVDCVIMETAFQIATGGLAVQIDPSSPDRHRSFHPTQYGRSPDESSTGPPMARPEQSY